MIESNYRSRFIGLVFFASVLLLCNAELPNDPNKAVWKGSNACNPKESPTILNHTESGIAFNLDKNNIACYWNIIVPEATDSGVFFFEIRSISLVFGDELKLTDNQTGQAFLLSKRSPGLYVLPILSNTNQTSNISLSLNLTSSTGVREFELFYRLDSNKINNLKPTGGNYWINVAPATAKLNGKVPSSVQISFQNSKAPLYKLAINAAKVNLAAKVSASLDGSPLSSTSDDALIDKKVFELSFDNFNFDAATEINFNFDYVDFECSDHKSSSDSNLVLKTISGNSYAAKESYRCVWIVESSPGTQILINQLLINSDFDSDSLEIRDGGKKSASVLIAQNPPSSFDLNKNLKDSKLELAKLVSNGNKVYITYDSPFALNDNSSKYVPNEINLKFTKQIKQVKGSVVQTFDYQPVADYLNAILIETDPNTRAVIQLKDGAAVVLNNLQVNYYDDFSINRQPILLIQNSTVVPAEVKSNTNQLLIIFYVLGSVSTKFSFIVQGVTDTCSFISNQPSVYRIDDSASLLGKRCTFKFNDLSTTIPKIHDYSLKVSHLALPTKDDCLTLQKTSATSKEVAFKLCGPHPDASSSDIIPNILLNSSRVYDLHYDRANNTNLINSTLLQAVFEFAPTSFVPIVHRLENGEKSNLTLPNYPNSYPLVYDTSISYLVQTNRLMYVSFNALDLAEGDSLIALKSNSSSYFANLTGHSLPATDYIVPDRLFVLMKPGNLQSRLDRNELFASGFSAEIQTLDCGGSIMDTKVQSTNYPQALSNDTSRCVWIVDASDTKQASWLQFQVEYGQDGEEGLLTVYDNPSKRRQLFANTTGTGPYNASISTVVIEYSKKGKTSMKGIKLTFERRACNGTCDGGTRCVTEWNLCDGVNQCADYTDELHCNTTFPIPSPVYIKSGLSGWVIIFFIIPISMSIGALGIIFGPKYLNFLRNRRYQEFPSYDDA